MFLLAALILIAIALVHGARARLKVERRVELVLVYLLAGYHGLIMLGVALFLLLASDRGAAMLSAPAGNVFQEFFGFAYLGMAVASILCIWLRGRYLVGPVVFWSLYFFGATYIHIAESSAAGRLTHQAILQIILSHTLLPCIMLGLMAWLLVLSRRTTSVSASSTT